MGATDDSIREVFCRQNPKGSVLWPARKIAPTHVFVREIAMKRVIVFLCGLFLLAGPAVSRAAAQSKLTYPPALDQGYGDMYNLQFVQNTGAMKL